MNFEQIQQASTQSIGIIKEMGVELLEAESGKVVMKMPLSPKSVNHFKTMYAGVQFTLAEVMGGALMMATFDVQQYVPIVGKVEIIFIKPVTSALTAQLTLSREQIEDVNQQLANSPKAQFDTSTELVDESGAVCAVSNARYYLIAQSELS